ncbi:hypothetical protein QYE76_014506 [Lolium multiflorum]|uniref:Reverse transcriptase Ty1/copia-type domain-containing protein n=1 Tax=Lolium multiflorum TaxID=4521 RepID=A0AAD8U4U9_LOLMU|nr:hypothetical protein QYE76_014506 [Lolium multiflorum]
MMHQPKNKNKTLPLVCKIKDKIKDKINQAFMMAPMRIQSTLALLRIVFKIKHMRMSNLKFEMSMMGEMKFFLGFEIKQLREGTFINQAKYLQDMLKRFKMTELKGVATPMVTKCHLALDPNGKEVDQKLRRHCRCLLTGTAGGTGTAGLGWAALPLLRWDMLRARRGS